MFIIVLLIEVTTIIASLFIIGDTQGWWKKEEGKPTKAKRR